MLRDQLDLLENCRGVKISETGEMWLRNLSLEASIGFGSSAALTLRASAVVVSSRFGEMFDKEMDRTQEAHEFSTGTSTSELY